MCRIIMDIREQRPFPFSMMPKAVRRQYAEKFEQTCDVRHPVYGEEEQASRLRSLKGFLKSLSEKPPDE